MKNARVFLTLTMVCLGVSLAADSVNHGKTQAAGTSSTSSNWRLALKELSPPARANHAMAYDGARSRVVVFGGRSFDFFDGTWEWDGTAWVEKTPDPSPPARDFHAMDLR